MTSDAPAWMPDLVETDGSWEETLDRLYGVFEADFVKGGLRYGGLPVWWDRRRKDDPREEGFWHLIERKNKAKGERQLDTARARRLRWCAATIRNATRPEVVVWEYREGDGRIRTYMWVKDSDYVVILEKTHRGGREVAYSLVTAFVLDGPARRKDMQEKYEARLP